MTPGARWALAAYPPSFRERYGDELEALVDDVSPSWRHTAGLFRGAATAWLRPAFTGPDPTRRRMQASLTTVWAAWCAGFMLAPAIDKALLDPPGAHVDATVRRLLDVSSALLVAGWALALAGATLVAARALVPALRAHRSSVLRPLVPALVLAVVEAVGLVVLAVATRTSDAKPSTTSVVIGTAWLVGLLALLVSSGLGPGVTIRQLHPDATVLRVPTMLAAALSVCLAALTATAGAAVVVAGDATLIGAFAPVAAVDAIGVVASVTAVVSSARGVLALRAPA
jgi:hypothetical protein